MAVVYTTTFQLRRGLASVWQKNNPVLDRGEPGFEIDTYRLKVGDGSTLWNDLPYVGNSEWFISPDGNSLVISENNELKLYGFEEADVNQVPVKGADGKLRWLTLDWASLTGYIDDLQQREVITLYGGSATEVI